MKTVSYNWVVDQQGKEKMDEGDSASLELEEEIEELAKKLIELQKGSKMKGLEIQNCINFDKQASLLQKQLEKYNEMQGENCVKETAEVSAVTLPFNSTREGKMKGHGSSRQTARFTDVRINLNLLNFIDYKQMHKLYVMLCF